MAYIDKFIDALYRLSADQLEVAPGARVILDVGDKRRPVTARPATAEQVNWLLREIRSGTLDVLGEESQEQQVVYSAPAGIVRITVERVDGLPRIRIMPYAADEALVAEAEGDGAATEPAGDGSGIVGEGNGTRSDLAGGPAAAADEVGATEEIEAPVSSETPIEAPSLASAEERVEDRIEASVSTEDEDSYSGAELQAAASQTEVQDTSAEAEDAPDQEYAGLVTAARAAFLSASAERYEPIRRIPIGVPEESDLRADSGQVAEADDAIADDSAEAESEFGERGPVGAYAEDGIADAHDETGASLAVAADLAELSSEPESHDVEDRADVAQLASLMEDESAAGAAADEDRHEDLSDDAATDDTTAAADQDLSLAADDALAAVVDEAVAAVDELLADAAHETPADAADEDLGDALDTDSGAGAADEVVADAVDDGPGDASDADSEAALEADGGPIEAAAEEPPAIEAEEEAASATEAQLDAPEQEDDYEASGDGELEEQSESFAEPTGSDLDSESVEETREAEFVAVALTVEDYAAEEEGAGDAPGDGDQEMASLTDEAIAEDESATVVDGWADPEQVVAAAAAHWREVKEALAAGVEDDADAPEMAADEAELEEAPGGVLEAEADEEMPFDGRGDEDEDVEAALDFEPAETDWAPLQEPEAEALPEGGDAEAGLEADSAPALVASFTPGERLEALFQRMVDEGWTDLHVSPGVAPLFRRNGEFMEFDGSLTADEAREMLLAFLSTDKVRELEASRHADFVLEVPDIGRFRCNLFEDHRGWGGLMRVISSDVPRVESIGLPAEIVDLCELSEGLVLITGPRGSGKSTTLAALIDYMNRTRSARVVTLEDPIEFVHVNRSCLISQREVRTHTESLAEALRAALREDPDVLVVGEMRDLETVATAIEAAEMGHLVFATLPTRTAASTIDRVLEQFPAGQQNRIRTMLAGCLKAVVSQTLVAGAGGGSVAAMEFLPVTAAVSNLIREGNTYQIPGLMETGAEEGMRTLNHVLVELVKYNKAKPLAARAAAVDKKELEALFAREGIDWRSGTWRQKKEEVAADDD